MPENRGNVEKMLSDYDAKLALHESFRATCEGLIRQLLRMDNLRLHSITSRVKERSHLAEKLSRLGKDYAELSDVTDVVGIRVITHFEDDVDRIAEVVLREFRIDLSHSIDKREALDPDRFGYISLHFVGSMREDRAALPEYREFAGVPCEIQVRSILQHAWAEIEHDLGYKARGTVPGPIRRRFSRLAGLLEIADREFTLIRDDLADHAARVGQEIGERPGDVGIDDVSLGAFVKTSEVSRSIDAEMADYVGAAIAEEDNLEMQRMAGMLRYVGINTIEELQPALESRRAVVVKQFKKRLSASRHGSLGEGIGIFHLFQVLLAEKNDPREIEKAFERFNVGDPHKLAEAAEEIVQAVRQAHKVAPHWRVVTFQILPSPRSPYCCEWSPCLPSSARSRPRR
jgi:putative GTP pyrophosphokinase